MKRLCQWYPSFPYVNFLCSLRTMLLVTHSHDPGVWKTGNNMLPNLANKCHHSSNTEFQKLYSILALPTVFSALGSLHYIPGASARYVTLCELPFDLPPMLKYSFWEYKQKWKTFVREPENPSLENFFIILQRWEVANIIARFGLCTPGKYETWISHVDTPASIPLEVKRRAKRSVLSL